jgi:addiction module HigA family antidote
MITMHPGEYLTMSYVEPLKITQRELAESLGVSKSAVSRLLAGESDLSPDMAVRLSLAFDRSAESWMLMQVKHSLNLAKASIDPTVVKQIVTKQDSHKAASLETA